MTGQPLNIVHRDISPQNILISFDGNVKVIDFGIAKASNNSESTRAGVIKGKPSYLSPEQISGEPLDGRCDIFALGIVLWELLCGRKLFAGESDLAVLKLIESCTSHVKPPSTINPQVPKELDYIVLRALAKQREKRYQTAEEMQRALHKFIYQFNSDFEPGALSLTAKDMFKNEIVEDRKRIHKLNEKVEQLLSLDIPETPVLSEETAAKKKEDNTTTMVDRNPCCTRCRVEHCIEQWPVSNCIRSVEHCFCFSVRRCHRATV
jgi:serine/threonine-protein kinase